MLSAGCEMPSVCAAMVRLPSSTAATRWRMRRKSSEAGISGVYLKVLRVYAHWRTGFAFEGRLDDGHPVPGGARPGPQKRLHRPADLRPGDGQHLREGLGLLRPRV